jgi:formylglycine-generating enzyme required for sulfatase activity
MASPPIPQPAQPAAPWRILRWRTRHLAHREELAPGVDLIMLRIPSGSFLMGAPEEEEGSLDDERPVHRVELGEFLLGQTPVTQAQWRAVAQWKRPDTVDPRQWPDQCPADPVAGLNDPDRFRGDQRPVVNVSWDEAKAFCDRLRLRTGKNYTLPSEAQWEYACRAGTTTPFHWGGMINTELANYNGETIFRDGKKGLYRRETTTVASFPANPWGLYDMHGNVWEWCEDHWHEDYTKSSNDGNAWVDNSLSRRLLRGGSWGNDPRNCRSAYRDGRRPDNRYINFGFRVCCLPQD